jgi:ADP-heptose:LPS heptosyltransferase
VAVNFHGRGPQSTRLLLDLQPLRLVAFTHPDVPETRGMPAWTPHEHEVNRWCRLVTAAGWPADPTDLDIRAPELGVDLHPYGVDLRRVRCCTVIHPGASSPARQWPVDRWVAVVRALCAEGHHVVVTGTPAEADLCAPLAAAGAEDLCGRLALPDLVRTVATARLLLCGDTGVAHVATAYATPSVLLFGPTPPSTWGPRLDPELHAVLWHGSDGDPPGDPHADIPDARLLEITVEEVLTASATTAATAVG